MSNQITTKILNDIKVRPIYGAGHDKKEIMGDEYFTELYSNIFLMAKKKSGKSTTLFSILKSCISKNTKVIIFSSTFFKDDTYIRMAEWLESKNIEYHSYDGLIDEDKSNLLDVAVKNMGKEESDEEEEIKVKKVRKKKKLTPDYIIIMDDLSSELRNKAVASLLKKNRHLKSRVIISSQWLNDLEPASIRNLDYVLLFKGMSIEKLETLYKQLDLSIEFDKFRDLYNYATNEIYNFLYIDVVKEKFRKNFNMEIV